MYGGEAVGICEFGEGTDVAAVFELDAWMMGKKVKYAMAGSQKMCENVQVAMGGNAGSGDGVEM